MSVFNEFKSPRRLILSVVLVLALLAALGAAFWGGWPKLAPAASTSRPLDGEALPSQGPVAPEKTAAELALAEQLAAAQKAAEEARTAQKAAEEALAAKLAEEQAAEQAAALAAQRQQAAQQVQAAKQAQQAAQQRQAQQSAQAAVDVRIVEPANAAGYAHYEAATYRNVSVEATLTTLANKHILGDMSIAPGVEGGALTLKNVRLDGTLYAYGASELLFENCAIHSLVLIKPRGIQRVYLAGETLIDACEIYTHAYIDGFELSLNGACGILAVNVLPGDRVWQSVTLQGLPVNSLSMAAAGNILLAEGSELGVLTARAPIHLAGTGALHQLLVNSDGVTYQHPPADIWMQGDYDSPRQSVLKFEERGLQ